jgi:hypothetical protein
VDVVDLMPDDIDLMQRWMAHPDTNRSAFEALIFETMTDAHTAAVMKVLNVVLRDASCVTDTKLLSA